MVSSVTTDVSKKEHAHAHAPVVIWGSNVIFLCNCIYLQITLAFLAGVSMAGLGSQ
jgi:hypothetical protein